MDDSVRITSEETLSHHWGRLSRIRFELRRRDGVWQPQVREVYDRGDAAVVLLCNPTQGTVILVRQFRIPLLRKESSPYLIEACAGVLEGDDPEACAKKEAEEETGFRVSHVRHVFDSYMSPGSVTEKLSFFLAEYDAESRVSEGGGLADEGEDIEVIEMPFAEALAKISTGEILDAKTIMLLQHAAIEGVFGGSVR
jgi:GDP-mannose pyrophosphatase NudK